MVHYTNLYHTNDEKANNSCKNKLLAFFNAPALDSFS